MPLPDAPSVSLAQQQDVVVVAETSRRASGDKIAPCSLTKAMREIHANPKTIGQIRIPCNELLNPYQRFLDTNISIPLTPRQKGYLAIHNFSSPANLLTAAVVATIIVVGFLIPPLVILVGWVK